MLARRYILLSCSCHVELLNSMPFAEDANEERPGNGDSVARERRPNHVRGRSVMKRMSIRAQNAASMRCPAAVEVSPAR